MPLTCEWSTESKNQRRNVAFCIPNTKVYHNAFDQISVRHWVVGNDIHGNASSKRPMRHRQWCHMLPNAVLFLDTRNVPPPPGTDNDIRACFNAVLQQYNE